MTDKPAYVVLQLKIRSGLSRILQRDVAEFEARAANGNIALHYHEGTVQKVHRLEVN